MFRKLLCLALALYLPVGHASFMRVDWRRSTFCGALLNAVHQTKLRRAGVTGAFVTRDRLALVDLTLEGQDVEGFFAAVNDSRRELLHQYEERETLRGFHWRHLRDYVKHIAQYDYGSIVAVYGFLQTLIFADALDYVATRTPAHLPGLLAITAGLGAVGLFDYPWRWARSYDLGLLKLRRGFSKFRKSSRPTFDFHRTITVSEELVRKLQRQNQLDLADLHAENVREEAPGLWGWYLFRRDPGATRYELRVDLHVDRAPAKLYLLITARPAPPRWPPRPPWRWWTRAFRSVGAAPGV